METSAFQGAEQWNEGSNGMMLTATSITIKQGTLKMRPILVRNSITLFMSWQKINHSLSWNYWESTEAKRLFLLDSDTDKSVKDALDQRIELLGDAISTPGSCKSLLPGKALQVAASHCFLVKEILTFSIQSLRSTSFYNKQWLWDLPMSTWKNGWKMAPDGKNAVKRQQIHWLMLFLLMSVHTVSKKGIISTTLLRSFCIQTKFVATGVKQEPNIFSLTPEAKGHLLAFAANSLDSLSI